MLVRERSLLFDANALVYWVNPTSPYNGEVSQMLQHALEANYTVYALGSSLSDVYYALHSHYTDEPTARRSIELIAEIFDLVDLTGLFVWKSIRSNEPDYEDGLIRAAAEALEVDAIISYDKKAFRNSPIPKLIAQEAMEELFQ